MTRSATEYWSLIFSERTRVADFVAKLDDEQWAAASLCPSWTVEQVIAHLSSAANTSAFGWLASMLRAKFDADAHNMRQLSYYMGDTPQETLDNFRSLTTSHTAPTKDYAAWLGEVIVHGQDIARALDLPLAPEPKAVREVAEYYSSKDFAVNSSSLVEGLRLEATDDDFATGEGPLVRGALLDLVMAMAGREVYLNDLTGEGVVEMRERLEEARAPREKVKNRK